MKRKIEIEIETSRGGQYCDKNCIGHGGMIDSCLYFWGKTMYSTELQKDGTKRLRCPECLKAEVKG